LGARPLEPLDASAARCAAGGEPWSPEVAAALARYAELRYGGIGEEHAVAQHLDELARKSLMIHRDRETGRTRRDL